MKSDLEQAVDALRKALDAGKLDVFPAPRLNGYAFMEVTGPSEIDHVNKVVYINIDEMAELEKSKYK